MAMMRITGNQGLRLLGTYNGIPNLFQENGRLNEWCETKLVSDKVFTRQGLRPDQPIGFVNLHQGAYVQSKVRSPIFLAVHVDRDRVDLFGLGDTRSGKELSVAPLVTHPICFSSRRDRPPFRAARVV